MHEKGYTFNGSAPISGLRQGEIAQIVLGHIVANEQEQEAAEEARGDKRRKYSSPKRSTDEALEDYEKKLKQDRGKSLN